MQGSIWHIALNPTDDFLLVCTAQHLRVYSAARLAEGDAQPLVELEMDMVRQGDRTGGLHWIGSHWTGSVHAQ